MEGLSDEYRESSGIQLHSVYWEGLEFVASQLITSQHSNLVQFTGLSTDTDWRKLVNIEQILKCLSIHVSLVAFRKETCAGFLFEGVYNESLFSIKHKKYLKAKFRDRDVVQIKRSAFKIWFRVRRSIPIHKGSATFFINSSFLKYYSESFQFSHSILLLTNSSCLRSSLSWLCLW